MKNTVFILLLFAFVLSCKEQEIQPKGSINEQIAAKLRAYGYKAQTDQDGVIMGGFKNKTEALLILNQIHEQLGLSKFDLTKSTATRPSINGRVECDVASDWYDAGDGYQCRQWFCVADLSWSSYSKVIGCDTQDCYWYKTSCIHDW